MTQPETLSDTSIFIDRSQFQLTQFGNRDRLLCKYGDIIKYDAQSDIFFVWNGRIWQRDFGSVIVKSYIVDVIEKMKDLELKDFVSLYGSIKERENAVKKYLAFWNSSQSAGHVDGIVRLLEAVPEIQCSETDFDQNPIIFNVKNGIIDLSSGKLLQHDKKFLCSKIANVEFDKNSKSELFNTFITEIMTGKTEVIAYLQKWYGFCLTGYPPGRKVLFQIGEGRNGKSTLTNVMMKLFGTYAIAMRTSSFLDNQYGRDKIGQDLVMSRGCRLITTQESKKGERLDEGRIKEMSGGDQLRGRYNNARTELQWQNKGKLVFSTNHKPNISGNDDGIWNRIHLLTFDYQIPEKLVDQKLDEKLQEELCGILNWLLSGCTQVISDNLNIEIPEYIKESGEEYRNEEDKLKQFLTDECIQQESLQISSVNLYRAYGEFCTKWGYKTENQKNFGRDIKRWEGKLYISKNRGSSGYFYKGITTKNSENEQSEWSGY